MEVRVLGDDEDGCVQRADDVVFSWPELHDGDDVVTVRRYFGQQLPWPIECEMWEIPPGGSEGPHTHPVDDVDGYDEADECYVVVAGVGEFTLGDQRHQLTVGDALFAPHDVVHGFRNTGAGTLRMMVFSDRPRREVVE